MPRIQVQDPFNGGASLRPTISPRQDPAGVAPPAKDNSLFALADALSEFNPELRGMLKDEQAKAQADALTLGDLKAAELSAKGRMDAINGQLKTFTDDGTISPARLPYFQRGFNRRAGRELALSEFAGALDARLADASKLSERADPETVITETLKDFRSRLPSGDIYAQEGFDQQAQRLADNFRQKAAATYTQNYEETGRLRIANEASDILSKLAHADTDEKDAVRSQFRQFFDSVKADELPKQQVAPFVVERAIAPLVRDLASRGQFDDAEDVLEEMETFDVTGQGGLLGATAAGRSAFAVLRNQIAEAKRTADDPSEVFAKKSKDAQLRGTSAAKTAVVELGAERLTYAKRDTLAEQFRTTNKDNPEAVFAYQNFLDDYIRQGPRPDDETTVAGVSRLLDTTNTERLSQAAETLAGASRAGLISPATELKLEKEIEKRRALSGLLTDEDAVTAERAIYRAEVGLDDTANRVLLPAFTSAKDYLSESLTPQQRLKHRQGVMQFYRDTLGAKLRGGSFSSVEDARAELPELRTEALTESIAYADKVTAALIPPKPEEKKPAAPAPKPVQPKPADLLKGTLDVAPTEATARGQWADRNRAAFLAFFAEPFQGSGADWKVSDAALSGQIGKLTSNPGDGPLTPLRPTTQTENAEAIARLRPVILYRSVKDSYYSLVKYRERGSDGGDPNYIKRLREFVLNLKTYGGTEYLKAEQLTQLGLKPEAFTNVGTKSGLIK